MLRRFEILTALFLLAGGATSALAASPPVQPAKDEFRARLIGAVADKLREGPATGPGRPGPLLGKLRHRAPLRALAGARWDTAPGLSADRGQNRQGTSLAPKPT